MDSVLEQLKNGVRRFRSEISPAQAELYAQAVIAGKRPDPNQRASIGCNIKWRQTVEVEGRQ